MKLNWWDKIDKNEVDKVKMFFFCFGFLFMKRDLCVIPLIQLNFQSFKKDPTKEQEGQSEIIEKLRSFTQGYEG